MRLVLRLAAVASLLLLATSFAACGGGSLPGTATGGATATGGSVSTGGSSTTGTGGSGVGGSRVTSTAPWPESCVPAANLDRPAGEGLLTGPAGAQSFGDPAAPGETMTATLNGYPRAWTRFAGAASGFVGYGFDGSMGITVPSLGPGTYACPDASIAWGNLNAGAHDSNSAGTVNCCTIEITRSGAVGEMIEGTFSGILVHMPLQSWIKIEDGHFSVVRKQ